MNNAAAELKMKKTILEGAERDEATYNCEVIRYDEENDCIYLNLKGANIEAISLDGIYYCKIYKENEGVECEGRVLERYCSQDGNILHFQVEKGFYKININCVDKEEA